MKTFFLSVLCVPFIGITYSSTAQWVQGNPIFARTTLAKDSIAFDLAWVGKADSSLEEAQVLINERYAEVLQDVFSIDVLNSYETSNGTDFSVHITDQHFYHEDVFFSRYRPDYGFFETSLSNVEASFKEGNLLKDIRTILEFLNTEYNKNKAPYIPGHRNLEGNILALDRKINNVDWAFPDSDLFSYLSLDPVLQERYANAIKNDYSLTIVRHYFENGAPNLMVQVYDARFDNLQPDDEQPLPSLLRRLSFVTDLSNIEASFSENRLREDIEDVLQRLNAEE